MGSIYKNKNVLVAGGTGLIGRPLVDKLINLQANVRIASLDDASRAHPKAEFLQSNLLLFRNCLEACDGMDYVFNLLGVKGSPALASSCPASYFVPTLTLDTNLMEAARQCGVKRFLFTSSIAVYPPANIFHEEDVWKRFPSSNDWFPAWAKRMGELQADAYRIEFGWKNIVIVRPANVYGPFDNFSLSNAMVIPSLIHRMVSGENPLRVWGDGSIRRDFVHAEDVAQGMLLALEFLPEKPINLGSGIGVSIRDLVELILKCGKSNPEVIWDSSKPTGDLSRVLDISRAQTIGFQPTISLERGIRQTFDWYQENFDLLNQRYDVFNSGSEKRLLI